MKQIKEALKRFGRWIKKWFWTKPVSKPPKQEPIRTMAVDVAKNYMVLSYHGQRINILRSAYDIWKMSSRADKRATMQKFAKQEKEGSIKFIEVDGHLICVANRDYAKRAEKAKNGN
jgi:hypothetical protein